MAGAKFKGNRDKRDGKQFVLLPKVVLDSPGYRLASYPARALLIDTAMQYTGYNNGKLTACAKYLAPKGWTSNNTVLRAVHELQACGLLIETRKGARPNKAAWFALSWLDLDQGIGLDIDPKLYRRGGYMAPEKSAPPRNSNSRTEKATEARKLSALAKRQAKQAAALTPSHGAARSSIAPLHGVRHSIPKPLDGAIHDTPDSNPPPLDGAYLEIPSAQGRAQALRSGPDPDVGGVAVMDAPISPALRAALKRAAASA